MKESINLGLLMLFQNSQRQKPITPRNYGKGRDGDDSIGLFHRLHLPILNLR
jgi:hypothetical protein